MALRDRQIGRDIRREGDIGPVACPTGVAGREGRRRAVNIHAIRPIDSRTQGVQRRNADSGRIVLGTTADAFFSLGRLAEFLRRAPLYLASVLNLDGGPVACQGIALGDYRRDFCGDWEFAMRDGDMQLLQPILGTRRWGLPIVLAVHRK